MVPNSSRWTRWNEFLCLKSKYKIIFNAQKLFHHLTHGLYLKDGFHGDCSKTFPVGDIDEEAKKLIQVTEECLQIGIDVCKPGALYHEIGFQIEAHAERNGFSIIPIFAGHGIGSYFHGPPDIYHVGNTYPGTMNPGVTFTIEPILSEGTSEVAILEDDWTAVTVDHSRSAQVEHTVLITEDGCEILTENDWT